MWPSWYLKEQERAGPGAFPWTHNGSPITTRDGAPIAPGQHRMRVLLSVCSPCNQTLGRRFEDPARPVLRRLFAAQGSTVLSATEAEVVGAWFAKTLLLLGSPDSRYDNPRVDRHAVRFAADEMPGQSFYSWLVDGQPAPEGLSVWLHRADLSVARPAKYAVPLPHVTADGAVQAFTQLEVGLHGLSATVAVHPGWPILYPLVADGAAAKVFPPSGSVDLRGLPVLWPKAVSWPRCRIELKPGVLGTPHLPPLQKAPDVLYEVFPHTLSWSA